MENLKTEFFRKQGFCRYCRQLSFIESGCAEDGAASERYAEGELFALE
jgi:hypothetical protein